MTGQERQRQAPASWPATLLRGGVPWVRTRRYTQVQRKRGTDVPDTRYIVFSFAEKKTQELCTEIGMRPHSYKPRSLA